MKNYYKNLHIIMINSILIVLYIINIVNGQINLPEPEKASAVVPLPYLSNLAIYEDSVEFIEPVALQSVNGKLNVKLTVEPYRFDNGFISFNTRAYCYNNVCSVPGPSLFCRPGDIVTIKLINKLKKTSSRVYNNNDEDITIGDGNLANVTNFYIHGIHLDPNDNDFSIATYGDKDYVTYEFKIPVDHPPGVYYNIF